MEARSDRGRLWVVDDWGQDIAWMITDRSSATRGSIHYFIESMGCGPKICLYDNLDDGKADLLEAFCVEEVL